MSYLSEKFRPSERGLILFAAVVLLPVLFLPVFPIWRMHMRAPQYPEGLNLSIYTNTIRGDVDKINMLNHYVGMHAITATDFREFTYMPQLLTGFGVLALFAGLTGRRWLAMLGWLAFTAFAVYMFRDYVLWLYHYGHDLDPRAAIKLQAFTPPVIGFKQMANFKVWSYPGLGTWLLGIAWALGPTALLAERYGRARAQAGAAIAGATKA
jgi:copper chaperone NosL